jgi:hypothetical protein
MTRNERNKVTIATLTLGMMRAISCYVQFILARPRHLSPGPKFQSSRLGQIIYRTLKIQESTIEVFKTTNTLLKRSIPEELSTESSSSQ